MENGDKRSKSVDYIKGSGSNDQDEPSNRQLKNLQAKIAFRKNQIVEMRKILERAHTLRYDRIRAFDKSFTNFTNEEMKAYLDLYDKNVDDRFEAAS